MLQKIYLTGRVRFNLLEKEKEKEKEEEEDIGKKRGKVK